MSKRNRRVTNSRQQMQRAVPHVRWSSSAAQNDWQRASVWHGVNSREAQAMFDVGVGLSIPKPLLKRAALKPTLKPVPAPRQPSKRQQETTALSGAIVMRTLLNFMRETRVRA